MIPPHVSSKSSLPVPVDLHHMVTAGHANSVDLVSSVEVTNLPKISSETPLTSRTWRSLGPNASEFEFDSDGILRNVNTGETLSMKVVFTGASLRRQEMIRAICTRHVRRRLFELTMESSQIPIPGHPTLCMRVLHSANLFTHTGPVLIVMQGGGVTQAGVWATRLLLHPQHGLRSGSQVDLIRIAHERGYAVVLINGNECIPNEAERDVFEFVPPFTDLPVHPKTTSWLEASSSSNRTILGSKIPLFNGPGDSPAQPDGRVIRSDLYNMPTLNTQLNNMLPADSVSTPGDKEATSLFPFSSANASTLFSLLLTSAATHNDAVSGTSSSSTSVSIPAAVGLVPSEPLQSSSSNSLCSSSNLHGQTSPVPSPSTVTAQSGVGDCIGEPPVLVSAHHRGTPEVCDDHRTRPCSSKTSTSNVFESDRLLTDSRVPITALPDPPQLAKFVEPRKVATPSKSSAKLSSSSGRTNLDRCHSTVSTKRDTNQRLGVSLEDRLYGVWRQIVPRLISDSIFVWAHQQGGVALIHPLKPMPGIFPGFPDNEEVTHRVKKDNSKTTVKTPSSTEQSSNEPVTRTSRSLQTEASRSGNSTSVVCQRSPGNVALPMACSQNTLFPSSEGNPAEPPVLNHSCVHPDTSIPIGLVQTSLTRTSAPTKVYTTRKRHVSANAVLSTTNRTTIASQDSRFGSDLNNPRRPIADPSANLAELEAVGLKRPSDRFWFDRRPDGLYRHRATVTSANETFDTEKQSSNTLVYTYQDNELDCNRPKEPILPFSSDREEVSSLTKKADVVPRNPGVWGPVSNCSYSTLPHMTLRLARAWQRKARRFQSELYSRVKGIVFIECPAVLDLAMEGIGWGTSLLEDVDEPSSAGTESVPLRPMVAGDTLPSRVIGIRKWLIENSVHYVAADSPLDTRLNPTFFRDQISVLSSSTTEHDLIPATVLKAAFNYFDSKRPCPIPTSSGSPVEANS